MPFVHHLHHHFFHAAAPATAPAAVVAPAAVATPAAPVAPPPAATVPLLHHHLHHAFHSRGDHFVHHLDQIVRNDVRDRARNMQERQALQTLRQLNPAAASAAAAQIAATPAPAAPYYSLPQLESQDQKLRERIDYVTHKADNYVNGESERQHLARNKEIEHLQQEEQWTRRALNTELHRADQLMRQQPQTTPAT
jgi:hypothetical protein